MTRQVVLQRRLETQRLQGSGLPSAADVVGLLGCVQSQEYAHALWSLGMRTTGLTAADVRAEFDHGHFLRTHILHPTWHFVAAEDIRWILEVTAPRVQKLNQTIYRQEGLDPATLERGLALIVEELKDRPYRTRAELRQALADQRLRLAYIVMNAELQGVICSGPMRGRQQTYALLEERVPRAAAVTGRRCGARAPVLPGSWAGRYSGLRSVVLAYHRPMSGCSRCGQGPVRLRHCGGSRALVRPGRTTGASVVRRAAAPAVRRADSELSGDQLSANGRSSAYPRARISS
jgi:hypothetical protein